MKLYREVGLQAPDMSRLEIVSGTSHPDLAAAVAAQLRTTLDPDCQVVSSVGRFADGEVSVKIHRNVRDRDVYVVHPVCRAAEDGGSVNDALVELLLQLQTLRLSGAGKVTAVVPYYGYARQDRKAGARTPISAAAVAQVISAFSPTRVVTVDLHCGQIQGFFPNIPVDNLYAERLIAAWVREHEHSGPLCIVSPDAGGVPRVRRLAGLLGVTNIVTVIKHRARANAVESVSLIGDVTGCTCVILDDMVDTAGTVCAAAAALKERGAVAVVVAATHGLFSGPAHDRLAASRIDHVVVTNTVPQTPYPHATPAMTVLDIAPLLADAICRLHEGRSLSELFEC